LFVFLREFNVHLTKGHRDEEALCLLMAVFLVNVPDAAWRAPHRSRKN